MPRLTPRENFQRMMEGRDPERLPYELPLTPPVRDRLERELGPSGRAALGGDLAGVYPAYHRVSPAAEWARAYRELGLTLPPTATIGNFGTVHTHPPAEDLGEAYHFAQLHAVLEPLETVEQLERLPWPAVEDPRLYEEFPAVIAADHARGQVSVGWMACTVFESTWYLRGMERLFFDLLEEHPVGIWLLDYFTRRSEAAVRASTLAGIDLIQLGDDIGSQQAMLMAPDFWREHFKPRLARVVRAVREAAPRKVWVAYHSDGFIEPVIPDLIEIGIDLLNPVQPECLEVDRLLPRFRDRLGFWGLIGTQTTMPFGTPDQVRAAVAGARAHWRAGARVLVAPTHVLEPDVPTANILAFVEEARQPLG